MPPRQGQSQFISPVSSLKAPSWLASDSVAERSVGVGEGDSVDDVEGVVVGDCDGDGDGAGWLRLGDMDSRVWREVSSVGF